MNMKNVKAITIPEGTVKKIENSNGDIIWGSYNAFPYRKLEYIHFNGAERIETPFYAGTSGVNYQSEFTIDEMPTGSNSVLYIGINDQTINNNLARLYLPQVNSTGIHINIGNTWSNYASETPINTKLKFSASISKTSGGNPRIYFYLYNQNTGVNILSADALQAGASGDLNTNKLLSIGAGRYITSSNDSYVSYWKGKCYNFQQRSGGASGTLLTNYIPCQRKSDGVCGVYDTINNEFLPMVGTTITDAAAGPVIDEYWNLQA